MNARQLLEKMNETQVHELFYVVVDKQGNKVSTGSEPDKEYGGRDIEALRKYYSRMNDELDVIELSADDYNNLTGAKKRWDDMQPRIMGRTHNQLAQMQRMSTPLRNSLETPLSEALTTSTVDKIFRDYATENNVDPEFKVWEPGKYDKDIQDIVVTIDGLFVDFYQENLMTSIEKKLDKLGYYIEPYSSSVLTIVKK